MTKKRDKDSDLQSDPLALTRVLTTYRRPDRTGFEDAWIGMEPTFQTKKSVKLWNKLSEEPGGEDAYFKSKYMLKVEQKVASGIEDTYRARNKKGKSDTPFAAVERKTDVDQWKVERQNLRFHWNDDELPDFVIRFGLDPETWEYSMKPVPMTWLYNDNFVAFLERFVWGVPQSYGLLPTIAHGGGQLSMSVKTLLGGCLIADEIAYRLNHPELATLIMDVPSADTRPFRATRERFTAFRNALTHYWAGGYHPVAIGGLTVESAILDRRLGPSPNPPDGLMDIHTGPIGSPRDIFQTNFAFGRALRWQAQYVHPGYWQGAHPSAEGYRSDQIMRYGEGNLNRLQIAGECHVKSGKTLDPERVMEFDAPLEIGMLYEEASYEDRAQMGKTSARDFVEAALLDLHHLRYLSQHQHLQVVDSLAQDQLLIDGEKTIERYAGADHLSKLRRAARKSNLEDSDGRVCSDFIEPETIFWEAWNVLPSGEKAVIAQEAVTAFVKRVHDAAGMDPRTAANGADPMEWHRHRIHPILWKALDGAGLKMRDPLRRELDRWKARRTEYLARRPKYSHSGEKPPWGTD